MLAFIHRYYQLYSALLEDIVSVLTRKRSFNLFHGLRDSGSAMVLGICFRLGGRPIRSQLISSYDHDICGGRVQKWSTGPFYNQHRDDVHNLNLNILFFAVHKQPQAVQNYAAQGRSVYAFKLTGLQLMPTSWLPA